MADSVVLKLECQDQLEGLLDPRQLAHSRVSDSVGLAKTPRSCISNKFPRDSDGAAPGTTLGQPLS